MGVEPRMESFAWGVARRFGRYPPHSSVIANGAIFLVGVVCGLLVAWWVG